MIRVWGWGAGEGHLTVSSLDGKWAPELQVSL